MLVSLSCCVCVSPGFEMEESIMFNVPIATDANDDFELLRQFPSQQV